MKKERETAFSPDEIRACLERVCAHQNFQASPKISRFLRFIVEMKLADKASGLKAHTIGVEVFDRPPGFDPDTGAIVRVNAVLYHIHFGQYPEALAAIGRFAGLDFFPFQVNLAVIHGHLGNLPEARRCLKRMFELWPDARHRLQEILEFWFPFEDVADIFAAGLTKAG